MNEGIGERRCVVCDAVFTDPDGPSVCYRHFRCPRCNAKLWTFEVRNHKCVCHNCGYVATHSRAECDIRMCHEKEVQKTKSGVNRTSL